MIVFNHSLTHTHNHRRHTEDRHMPRRPPCTKLSLSTSQRITIQRSKASHAEREHIHQLRQTGSEPSLKNEICRCLAQNVHSIKTSEMSQAPFKTVWNCWEPFVWCMSYWALTKAARLCQSNPKVPQLCSIQNVSDITSPKNHFHDDTAELAEFLAFRHHFKMMTIVFLLDSGMEVWISSHSNQSMHCPFLFCFCHFFFCSTFNYANNKRGKKSRLSLEKPLIDSSQRKPEPKHRSLALVLQTEKLLTHPASCHHAKGSTNPPPQVAHWSMTGSRDKAMGGCKKKSQEERGRKEPPGSEM